MFLFAKKGAAEKRNGRVIVQIACAVGTAGFTTASLHKS